MQGIDNFRLILQLFIALSIIIGLIYLTFKILNIKSNIIKRSKLSNLGGISLGQNKSVQLIKIGNKIYVLGVGDDVVLIKIIDNEDEINLIEQSEEFNKKSLNFERYLNSFTDKLFKKKNNQIEFEEFLTQKLNDIKETKQKLMENEHEMKFYKENGREHEEN